jgi:murein tripeptide amidase MpaA
MQISSSFDGGNIRCRKLDSFDNIQLAIRKDRNSDFFQWFYFRLTGASGKACRLNIMNAGQVAYKEGFVDYQAVASYDRETWFRVPTTFDSQILTISFTPKMDSIYFAYFAPYTIERHTNLISRILLSPRVKYENLGHTLDGQDIDFLTIGESGAGKKRCWFMARQHPGETMAEWWMEGFLAKILDEHDPISRELLKKCVFYVVPNMNPDGSRRGHLRTNASGANLNREWENPSMEHSPEVYLVRQKMLETGVDFCLDVHGDEALPYNFLCGSYGVPCWNPTLEKELDSFLLALIKISPDFQTAHGYPKDKARQANLSIAKNYVAQTFQCLSMTLEMPFKDTIDTPDEYAGWSPERCRHLGSAILLALHSAG